jgi:peptidyl-prolyl cis-trans isomerase D
MAVLQLMDNRARPNEAISAFESFIAQNIMLRKLQNLSGAMAWLPPEQVELGLADETDFRAVQYVEIPRSSFTASVAVAEADARAVYNGDTNRFALPEQVRVRYVEFAFTNFADRVSITETNIATYYQGNVDERYTRLDTNNLSVVTPLSEVRAEIAALLKREALSEAADVAATRMAMRLVRGRAGPPLPFDEAAAREGVPVRTTEFFSAGEDVPGLRAGIDFSQASFELQTGAVRNVSGVIAGEEARYVLAALNRRPPRLPAFEEVADRAMRIARSNAQERAFSEHVGGVRRKLAEALEGGKDFAAAAAEAGLALQTTGTFSVFSGLPEGIRNAEGIVRAIRTLPARALSEPVITAEAGLVLYVAGRTPAPPAVIARIRPRMLGKLQSDRAGLTFRSWQESMLREAKPEEPGAEQPESPEQTGAGGKDAG